MSRKKYSKEFKIQVVKQVVEEGKKVSHIGHAHHKLYSPISEVKVERILNLVNLKPLDKGINIGSGKCEI